jgi:hypothetical protein
MARRISIPYQKIALKVVGKYGDFLTHRVQRLDFPTTIPTTDIKELGNPTNAGVISDIPEVTATFQVMDVGIKVFATLTGNDYTNYPAGGVSVTDLGKVDLIGVIKDKDVADYVKAVHVKKAQVTDFTYSYSVDAEATEEYTLSANEKAWFSNDIVVETFNSTEAASSPVALSETPVVRKNGNYAISVMMDGTYLTEVASGPATGQYSIDDAAPEISFADSVSDRLVVIYQADPSGNNWSNVSDDTVPAAVYGKNIPVTIAANSVSRVQSVNIRGTFPNTVVKEMGTASVVGTTVQAPEITGDISVLDTDTDLIALLTTGELEPAGETEWRVCELTESGISLKVEINDPEEDPCGDSDSPTVLKTLYIPEIIITSEGHTSNVGEDVTQTFDFKSKSGDMTVYSGSM